MADDEGGGGVRSDIRSGVVFVFIILLFLIAVWFLTGGPTRSGNARNLFLSGPFATSSFISVPSINMNVGVPSGEYQSGTKGEQNYTGPTPTGITPDLTSTQSASLGLQSLPTSPYAGKVRLSAGGGTYASSYKEEYVVVRANPNNLQRITISGWKLQSAINKKTAVIYQGVEVYQPAFTQTGGAIVLNPGDTAVISTGRSPVGVSFRENKCSGYLSQYQEFYPRLNEDCPLPLDEALNYVSNGQPISDSECLRYLQGMPRCHLTINPPALLPDSCRSLINNTLTYNGCVSRHLGDADFKRTEWRIFLSYSEKLWRTNREVLTLLDSEGKLVDSIVF